MATAKKVTVPAMYSFTTIVKGLPVPQSKAIMPISADDMLAFSKSSDDLNTHFVGCLLAGIKPVFASPAELNTYLAEKNGKKIDRSISKENALRLVLTKVANIRAINSEPLQSLWDAFTTNKIAEIAKGKVENAGLESKGEKAKTLPRITEPNLKALLDLVTPEVEIDHLASAIKSMKTAYNHMLELKGKKSQSDSEKLAAIIVSNGGAI